MPKAALAYGIGIPQIPVLPLPLSFETTPVGSTNENFEIGQLVYTPSPSLAFYIYGGGGQWVQFANSSGDILAINGTANQITASTVAGTTTLSLPAAITSPGSLTTTTSLSATTTITAGTGVIATTGGVTATAGNLTATNGNLSLGTAGNKIIIATGSNASVGTSSAMSGTPGVVTVATTACSASAKVFYSRATTGGTPGQVSITAQDGTGFTLTSTGNETSTFNWWIINA